MPIGGTEGAHLAPVQVADRTDLLGLSADRPARRRWHRVCEMDRVAPSSQARVVLAIFFVTQFLDGALTYWGVSRFGVQIEFNSWLASLMTSIGPAPALLTAKALACLCGVVLFVTTSFRVLAVATGWCLGFAVVPWVALAAAFG